MSICGGCDTCGRQWTGHAEAHCPACCRHFSSDRGFQRHITAHGCEDPAKLTRRNGMPVFVLLDRVSGPTWVLRDALRERNLAAIA